MRLSSALLCGVLAATPAIAAPSVTAPSGNAGSPSPASPDPCPSYEPSTYVDLFAHPIDDPVVLHFVRYLETDVRARRAATMQSVPADVAIRAAAGSCDTSVARFVFGREAAAVSVYWGITAAADAARVSDELEVAALALVARHRFDETAVDAALAPFGTTLASLRAPLPADATAAPCASADADARIDHLVQPEYPVVAQQSRAAGRVELRVDLDERGDVVAARTFGRQSVPFGVGGDALVDAAVLAAATSTFVPGRVACTPRGGSYIYRADFRGRG